MQRVEHRDQVEVHSRKILSACGFEPDVAQSLRMLLCPCDRRLVEVDAYEFGLRERLGHDQGRCAMATADVGDSGAALELLHHAIECRQPCGDQVRAIARPEEALDAAEQAVATVAPAETFAGAEGLLKPRLVSKDRCERMEATGHI